MKRSELETALTETRNILHDAIITASFGGKSSANGQEAKNAAIRSSRPIQKVHTVIRDSIYSELKRRGANAEIWPPIGSNSPELKVTGLLKAKNQDIAVTVEKHISELIDTGVHSGKIDPIGLKATNSALIIGVRSQLSSLEKNFDTLAERAFAETLNLRLRAPKITLGEVYLVPVNEFDDRSLKENKFGFKNSPINLDKFVRIFKAITSDKSGINRDSIYKYNQTALIVADFSKPQVRVLWTKDELAERFGNDVASEMVPLLPGTFTESIVQTYLSSIT